MKRQNSRRGFTMAEMLIVVAIIGVLGAVAFVAVNQHQRSLERLERDSVAREIFVAAQNHLTMAKGQGYLGAGAGKGVAEDAEKGIYFFVVNQGDAFSSDASTKTLVDLMLPFGAIDETVRGGGSYIIRYHPDSATVMDVFYCSNPAIDTRYGCNLSGDDEPTLVQNWRDGKESARNNYNGKVLGWYGGAEGGSLKPDPDDLLEAPLLVVENADKLRVGVVDKNTRGSLQIIVKGKLSNVQMVFNLKTDGTDQTSDRLDSVNLSVDGITCKYVIILDDITTPNMHFADLKGVKNGGEAPFIPGEDVVVQAIAFNNTRISNIGYSAEITVNSLYEKYEEGVKDAQGNIPMTAFVSSIRHLENLDKRVSNVYDKRDDGSATYLLNNAVQTSDLSWSTFKNNTNGNSTAIQLYGTAAGATEAGCYLPVVPTNALTYDGDHHSVSDVKVNYAGNAGLFGTITGVSGTENPTGIKDLALIDFDITQTGNGNAGALAGTLNNVKVENVIAYNSGPKKVGAVAGSGSAGGLIGSATGCAIEKSAAAMIVSSDAGNAGGLIGDTSGGGLSACYSGGHTHDGAYYRINPDDGTKTADYNITAAKNAGGLIGVATSTSIEYSYSTCSATGATVGGLVGSSNGTIRHSYCTGLVKSTAATPAEGAFAGAWSGMTADDGNYYFDIINERREEDEAGNITGYTCLPPYPVSGTNTPVGISAIDETAQTYDDFCGAPGDWDPASPIDTKLLEYYSGKYNLQTVKRLGATITRNSGMEGDSTITDYVAIHYGDWPAPEIFVLNK